MPSSKSLFCALMFIALAMPGRGEADYTLGQALEQLRREGVQTLYTSRLVDPEAPIDERLLPDAGSAEERLRTLLAPLGLVARPAADGQFIISLAPSGVLEGVVRADPSGQPIPFARVDLRPGASAISLPVSSATSDAAGRFRILRLPEGRQSLEISRPGYLSRSLEIDIVAGARLRLETTLRLDAETSDEISVSTTSEEPPLGTWQLSLEQTRDSLLIEQDVLAAASRLPGTRAGTGVAFGVRGHDSQRLTLVVDGIEIAEPYHFRHLGSLAGAVTPSAIDDLRLHRGSPPVAYGDRAGGVLEVLTETTSNRFAARLGVADETRQAALSGNVLDARLRWLAAYRRGTPDLPPAASGLDSKPSYWDGLAKLTSTLSARQELTFQTQWAADDFLTSVENPFITALTILQDSRYSHLRYLGALGDRHLLDLRLSQSEIERRRFGQEQEADILTPPNTNEDFVLDDRRRTRRTTTHADGISSLSDRFEWRWGAEHERETTAYDYVLFAPFRQDPSSQIFLPTLFRGDLRQRRLGLYSQATWRPRNNLATFGGLRFDDDELSGETAFMPRLGASLRHRSGVWRAGWTRVRDFPSSHEQLLADGEERLPGSETSDYVSLGYQLNRGAGSFSVEAYYQHIENPRLRFENLLRSVGRFPELEIDRLRVAAEKSRSRGLEVSYSVRGRRFDASATYELSRFEDLWPDQRWRPRRSDRRHAMHLWLAVELPLGLSANLLWRGSSGRPTTPLDLELATGDFPAAIGEINSERLSSEHQLDLRLSRDWQFSTTALRTVIGIDNLYDHKSVTGFDLLPLRNTQPPAAELPAERTLGRELRWSLELSW